MVARAGGEGQRTRSGLSRAPRLAWPLAHPAASSTRGLDENGLSGTVPTELTLLTGLGVLTLANSAPNPGVPDAYVSAAPLPLSGTVPTELTKLEGLGLLVLQYTSLSGTLPPQLANLTGLGSVYWDFNRLSGTIPPEHQAGYAAAMQTDDMLVALDLIKYNVSVGGARLSLLRDVIDRQHGQNKPHSTQRPRRRPTRLPPGL